MAPRAGGARRSPLIPVFFAAAAKFDTL